MKALYILIVSLLLSQTIIAQTTPTPQIILLKDGSMLKGTVLEENINGQLKIALSTGDELEIPLILVESIRKNTEQETTFPNGSKISTQGFYQMVQFGVLPGFANEDEEDLLWGITAKYSAGYRFHPLFAVGLGMGVDHYNQFMMPIYVEAKGYFLEKAVSPYYSVSAGHGFPFQFRQDWIQKTGGTMFNPAVGMRIARTKHVFHMDLGYQQQKAILRSSNWETVTDRITYRRWVIRLGWEF